MGKAVSLPCERLEIIVLDTFSSQCEWCQKFQEIGQHEALGREIRLQGVGDTET